MARVVKPEEYAEKRNEILDSAYRLIYSKGFEAMSIQDILNDLHISKGAFYHYFDSKPDLLEALVERIGVEAERVILPIAQEPSLDTLAKLRCLFATISRYKTEQKEFLFALYRAWYDDTNALVRQKVITNTVSRFSPILSNIVKQGVEEGVLNTPFPEQAGELIWSLMQGMSDPLTQVFLNPKPSDDDLGRIEKVIAAYTDAMERLLGAPTGSLEIVDMDTMREWLEVAKQFAKAG
jgi:AcrR family transcriptional regulator